MSKVKDTVPISVTRTNKTTALLILLGGDESVDKVTATRWMYTTQTGTEVQIPVQIADVSLDGSEVDSAIKNKITDLLALVDAKDI